MTFGWGRSRGGIVAGLVALAVACTFAIATPSQASFPGTNGLVAYVKDGNAFVVNPGSPSPTQVTNTGNLGADVEFNAQGNKLVGSSGAGLIIMSPVAGSAITIVPNTSNLDFTPGFDPTGTKLVFNFVDAGFVQQEGGELEKIATIDVTGVGRTTIRDNGIRPDWSADGTFIAFSDSFGTSILRMSPTGGSLTTLATKGPGGRPCGGADACYQATVSPDSKNVAYAQGTECNPCQPPPPNTGPGGIAEVNSDGSTLQPRRITTETPSGVEGQTNEDEYPSYSPDGTKIAFNREGTGSGTGLSTVPTDGSGTVTPVGTIGQVVDTSWGVAAGTGTGTGNGTGTGTGGITYSVSAPSGKVKDGPCVFTVTASAPVTGSVAFTIGVDSGRNAPSPANGTVTFANETSKTVSIDVKHSKRKHGDVSLTLSSPVGGSLGTPSSATCDVGKR